MYTVSYEFTENYTFFAFFSQELNSSVCFYIDNENYSESKDICKSADSLLLELGFIPGKLEN